MSPVKPSSVFDRWMKAHACEVAIGGNGYFKWQRHVDGIARQDAGRVRPVDLTGSSDCPEQCPVKGYNGSIFMGAISRRWSQP